MYIIISVWPFDPVKCLVALCAHDSILVGNIFIKERCEAISFLDNITLYNLYSASAALQFPIVQWETDQRRRPLICFRLW